MGSCRPRNLSTSAIRSGVAACPAASRAGLAGTRKKITYVTIVTAKNRTAAQSTRLTRYWNMTRKLTPVVWKRGAPCGAPRSTCVESGLADGHEHGADLTVRDIAAHVRAEEATRGARDVRGIRGAIRHDVTVERGVQVQTLGAGSGIRPIQLLREVLH